MNSNLIDDKIKFQLSASIDNKKEEFLMYFFILMAEKKILIKFY